MKAKALRLLLEKLHDDTEVNVSDKTITAYDDDSEPDPRWWDIVGFDSSTSKANSFGQINLVLSTQPVME